MPSLSYMKNDVTFLVSLFPESTDVSILSVCATSGLYPFVVTAAGENFCLDSMFDLLQGFVGQRDLLEPR
jgi:hypothetical protein